MLRGVENGIQRAVKSFSRIRDYMRDFYVYGFKHREEYNAKSSRSYDNERRRIESWLGEHMAFRQNAEGKSVFISIDSRSIAHNPLYKAFKAKSFTANDIMLNFFILDALADNVSYTTPEIMDKLENEYMSFFDSPLTLDESTVRLKLREYGELGLLFSEKKGKQLYYRLNRDTVPLHEWTDALTFFSEEDPLGVVGSYLLDKLNDTTDPFCFKHHYILHALESEVLYGLLSAIGTKRRAMIDIYNPRRGRPSSQLITPLRILVSTQGGRRYLLAHSNSARRMKLFRLDSIKAVKQHEADETFDRLQQQAVNFMRHLWGVSSGDDASLDHIEITINSGPGEEYIPARLEREKRSGSVEKIGDGLHRFSADVYDAVELLPWLRTFIGRIVSLECSNKYVREAILSDINALNRMYQGGETDVVS